MRSIDVISASPPGVNPGMASVDAAFDAFARRHGFADRVRYWRLYPADGGPADTRLDAGAKRTYRLLGDMAQLTESTAALVYWGDFFHMWQYQRAVADVLLRRGLADGQEAALQRGRDVFLLERSPAEALAKTISFGGTLLFNTLEDEQRPGYGPALQRFLAGSRAVWFRDVFSAFKASQACAYDGPSHLCTDCAALAGGELRPQAEGRDSIGIFLGRSGRAHEATLAFASEIAERLGRPLLWQPWGDERAFPALRTSMDNPSLRGLPNCSPLPSENPLEALDQHQCLITDTYHICVNAWLRGIPAICVADSAPLTERSVNSGPPFAARDKRFAFFAMYDALDFFVPADELLHDDQRALRLGRVCALLAQPDHIQAIVHKLGAHARASERALLGALTPLLSTG